MNHSNTTEWEGKRQTERQVKDRSELKTKKERKINVKEIRMMVETGII